MNRQDLMDIEKINKLRRNIFTENQLQITQEMSELLRHSLEPICLVLTIAKNKNIRLNQMLLKSTIITLLLTENNNIDEAFTTLKDIEKELIKVDKEINTG